MKRQLIVILSLVMLFILIGCQQSADEESQAKIPVSVQEVEKGNVERTLAFNGDIHAEQEVKVFSKIPDRIKAFYADEGDYVKKGGLIAEIVATTIEQAVLQAEAQKNNMETEYARAKRLYQENAMSQQQFDVIETQVTQARAAYKSIKSQLDDARVLAPISGIIGKRYYEEGDMANPAQPVVSIVQMGKVKITIEVPEKELGLLEVGQDAEIEVVSYPDLVFYGKVDKISPVLDPMTRMATVEILVDNPKRLLRPGMYATIEITVGTIKDVLVVPRHAVLESTSLKKIDGVDTVIRNYFVYVANDSIAEQRELNVSYVNHRFVAVRGGIEEGENMVVNGQNNLRDGLPVLIVEEEE
ncbi:efflux RND transporter periplasmic adaptor subunit [bacterium]|nr:efflux RND transporter periplasmic adaptor subunit [bacterium]